MGWCFSSVTRRKVWFFSRKCHGKRDILMGFEGFGELEDELVLIRCLEVKFKKMSWREIGKERDGDVDN